MMVKLGHASIPAVPIAAAPPGPPPTQLGHQGGTQRRGWALGPFWKSWTRTRVPADRLVMAIMLVLWLISNARDRSCTTATRTNQALTLAYVTVLAACLCWAQASPHTYALWRDVPAFVVPLAAVVHPCTWEVTLQALADTGLWEAGPLAGAAAFWGALVFSTTLPFLMLVGLGWPRRCLLHWATQAALVAVVLRHVPAVCDAPLLAHPASLAQLSGAQTALRAAATAFALPGAAQDAVPAGVQCRSVLSMLVCMLGFVVPVLLVAIWEWEAYLRWAAEQQQAQLQQQQQLSGVARRHVQGTGFSAVPSLLPAAPGEVQGLGNPGGGCQACRLAALLLLLVMLATTVWDICLKLYS